MSVRINGVDCQFRTIDVEVIQDAPPNGAWVRNADGQEVKLDVYVPVRVGHALKTYALFSPGGACGLGTLNTITGDYGRADYIPEGWEVGLDTEEFRVLSDTARTCAKEQVPPEVFQQRLEAAITKFQAAKAEAAKAAARLEAEKKQFRTGMTLKLLAGAAVVVAVFVMVLS